MNGQQRGLGRRLIQNSVPPNANDPATDFGHKAVTQGKGPHFGAADVVKVSGLQYFHDLVPVRFDGTADVGFLAYHQ